MQSGTFTPYTRDTATNATHRQQFLRTRRIYHLQDCHSDQHPWSNGRWSMVCMVCFYCSR